MSVPQKSSFLRLFLKFSVGSLWKSDSKQKFPILANRLESMFSSAKCFGTKILKVCFFFLFHGTEFLVVFSFAERFRMPRVFCFMEQPEFLQNKPFVSSTVFCMSSAELFFFIGHSKPYSVGVSYRIGKLCLLHREKKSKIEKRKVSLRSGSVNEGVDLFQYVLTLINIEIFQNAQSLWTSSSLYTSHDMTLRVLGPGRILYYNNATRNYASHFSLIYEFASRFNVKLLLILYYKETLFAFLTEW